jgi:hypothetical protein
VQTPSDGNTYIKISDVPASEVLVLTNHPDADAGGLM